MELQLKSEWEVRVKHALNGGFVVHVGCAEFAYSSSTQLCKDLKLYLDDPKVYEDKYQEIMGHLKHAVEVPAPEQCEPQTDPMEMPGPTPVKVETTGTPPIIEDTGTDEAEKQA